MVEPVFIKSSLGARHGWFERSGGVSEGDFASLNVKKGFADSDENVTENRRRACRVLDANPDEMVFIRHEHGDELLIADEQTEPGDYIADATITNVPGRVLAQGTADCGTIVLSDPAGKVVGLIHASWRTLRTDLIQKTMAAIKEMTDEPISAALGPMACAKCYEFGDEATDLFDTKYLKTIKGRQHVDMATMIVDQLKSAGVNSIENLSVCTIEDERFFSHRRDKNADGECGRFLTLVSTKNA